MRASLFFYFSVYKLKPAKFFRIPGFFRWS